jgi:hypothetical protein
VQAVGRSFEAPPLPRLQGILSHQPGEAGDDSGGRPRRGIERLIGVAAGERERRDARMTWNRTGAFQLIGAGQWDVCLVDAQEKSAITRSVARGGDLIEQRTLNFNSMRRQEWSKLYLICGEADCRIMGTM